MGVETEHAPQERTSAPVAGARPAHRPHRRAPTAVAAMASAALVLLGGTGCSNGPAASQDQPAAADGSLTSGDFEGLPKPEGAVPVDDPIQRGDSVVQSFRISGSTPGRVLLFYGSRLPVSGWQVSSSPSQVGADEWNGEWADSDQTLRVDATGETDSGDNAEVSQLDLALSTG